MAEPQNGRIGGGVLADNLLRNGIDLKFYQSSGLVAEPIPLLHLDVNNSRIGVNIDGPGFDLETPVDLRSTNLIATTTTIDNFDIANSRIDYFTGADLLLSSNSTIEATSIATDDLLFDYNTVSSRTANTNIELRPDGTGEINIRSNWNSTGDIHATGDITFGGNLTLGDNDTDNVTFNADLDSSLIPDANNTYQLGNTAKRWLNLYSNLLNGQRVTVGSFSVSDTSLAVRQGNIFYVSTLGDDTNVGDHQHGAFRTIKHALDVVDASSAGPVTIHVYPGEYEEEFPLIVPERVTISGEDIRNCIIKPTAGTNTNNAFEVNQNVTIENITIKDFFSPGYAFTFANNAIITERSPYIRNITVITKGSVVSATDPRGFDQ